MLTHKQRRILRVIDGGPGSGNWGHAGRPNLVGGSRKGSGGVEMRNVPGTGGFIGAKTIELFRSAAKKSHDTKDHASWHKALKADELQAIRDQYENVKKQLGSSESFEEYAARLHKMLTTGYEKPKAGKAKEAPKPKPQPITGKDMAKTFVPDPTQEHRINDIVHQQGFDGFPTSVSSEEFDKIAAENPNMPLLFRTYSGPDQATIDLYDQMYESGDWYIDCSTGAAYEGQGMYTCAKFDHGSKSEAHHVKMEMGRYQRYSRQHAYEKMPAPAGTHKIKDTHTGEITFLEKEPVSFAEGKPKDGQIVYLKSGSGSTNHKGEIIDSGYRGYYYHDGALYNINDQDIEFDPDHEHYSKAMTVTPSMKFYPEADHKKYGIPDVVSTIRRMTLDPSAKIITPSKCEALCAQYNNGLQARAYTEASKLVKSGAAGFDPMKAFPNLKMTPQDMAAKMAGNPQMVGTGLQLMNEYGNDPAKFQEDVGAYASWRLFEDLKKNNPHFGDVENPFTLPSPEKSAILEQAFKAPGVHLPNSVWMKKAMDKFAPDMSSLRITDHGQIAALYGYDAINASGSAAGQYVIVVNRTKVILDSSPVVKKEIV